MHRIGLISDTHGLLRPQALTALRGCEHIVHAGDIGNPEILEQLGAVAPVTVVRGNNDTAAWAADLAEIAQLKIEQTAIYVLHDLKQLNIDPAQAGFQVVIAGHSHCPLVERRSDVLYVNPGSAGPRRFSLPITVAELLIAGASVSAHIIELSTDTTVSKAARKPTHRARANHNSHPR